MGAVLRDHLLVFGDADWKVQQAVENELGESLPHQVYTADTHTVTTILARVSFASAVNQTRATSESDVAELFERVGDIPMRNAKVVIISESFYYYWKMTDKQLMIDRFPGAESIFDVNGDQVERVK